MIWKYIDRIYKFSFKNIIKHALKRSSWFFIVDICKCYIRFDWKNFIKIVNELNDLPKCI